MKQFLVLFLIILLCSTALVIGHADAGPKPSITVVMKNMPDIVCYADLLIKVEYDPGRSNKFNQLKYNQMLVEKLVKYNVEGWIPIVTNGLYRVYGDIICEIKNEKCVMNFSYIAPDKFKIIVVTESGEVVVSNEVKKRAFNSIIYFDFKTGEAEEGPLLISYILQFITTCILTLIMEGMVLLLFRFNLKKNLKPFLAINILTQVLLTVIIFWGMYSMGIFGAIILYLFAEIIIFMLEARLFAKYLREHSESRRVIFSITANILSFFLGLVLMQIA